MRDPQPSGGRGALSELRCGQSISPAASDCAKAVFSAPAISVPAPEVNLMLRRLAEYAFNNAYLLLSAMGLFWAGNQVLGRAAAGHIPDRPRVPTLDVCNRYRAALRHASPQAGLAGGAKRGPCWLSRCDRRRGVQHVAVYRVELYDRPQQPGLNSTAPVLIAIACVFLFNDRLTVRQVIGILISMVGVLVVVSRGELGVLLTLSLNRGDLLILLGMVTTAIYTAYLRLRPRIEWITFLFWMFLASALFNLPLVLIEMFVFGKIIQPTLFTFLTVGYVSIFPSILAYLFFARGVELIGGVRAGIFMHLIPLYGALLAIWLLGASRPVPRRRVRVDFGGCSTNEPQTMRFAARKTVDPFDRNYC